MPEIPWNFAMKLKASTIVLSIIAIALEADAYTTWPFRRSEEFYMALLAVGMIMTILITAGTIFGVIPSTPVWRKVETSFYGIMAALLLLSWILVIVSAADHSHYGWSFFSWYTQWQAETAFALIFGVIIILLYVYIGYLVYRAEAEE